MHLNTILKSWMYLRMQFCYGRISSNTHCIHVASSKCISIIRCKVKVECIFTHLNTFTITLHIPILFFLFADCCRFFVLILVIFALNISFCIIIIIFYVAICIQMLNRAPFIFICLFVCFQVKNENNCNGKDESKFEIYCNIFVCFGNESKNRKCIWICIFNS